MGCKGRTVAKSKERTSGTLRRHRGLKDRNETSRARERPWKRAVVLAEAHGRRSPSGGGPCLWGRRRIGQTGRVTNEQEGAFCEWRWDARCNFPEVPRVPGAPGGVRGVCTPDRAGPASHDSPELQERPQPSNTKHRDPPLSDTPNSKVLLDRIGAPGEPVSIQNLLRTGTQVPVCDSTQYSAVWFVFCLGISRA